MKFFIDTANLEQIKEANDLGILDGVTTNPSLMAKEGVKGNDAVMKHYVDICEMVDGDISAEVISTDFDGIIEEGKNRIDITGLPRGGYFLQVGNGEKQKILKQ